MELQNDNNNGFTNTPPNPKLMQLVDPVLPCQVGRSTLNKKNKQTMFR